MRPGAWFPGRLADAAMRVFCLPHAGGSASAYRAWSGDAELAIQPVQPPGREGRFREPAYTRMSDYVADLADAIAPLVERPYGLLGHSLGALVAFELARALRDRGRAAPRRLLVSGCPGPRMPRRQLHDLPEPALIAALQRMGGLAPEVLANRDLLDLVLPIVRADFEVADRYGYAPGPLLSCPITALVGTDDPVASAADAAAWADETSGPFRLHELPGDHFFLHTAAAGARVRAEALSP
ncbi:MAG TPA: alpha/beta fold hydrolase [Kofleriaceae bacterium]|nr:alpha/beta fold hydrolase [Kofleriaceae bacterium]